MSDRHLVRKIARHYSREIEIAVLTRGISEISGLEVLLQEFMHVKGRHDYNGEQNMMWQKHTEVRRENENGERPQFHRHKGQGNKRYDKEKAGQKGDCITETFKRESGAINSVGKVAEPRPSTSKN